MNAVTARRLTKRYGPLTAVAHIDLDVPQGHVFGMLGPNGAGKSTTIKMICGMAQKTDGELLVLGMDSDRDRRKINALLGVMPQNDNLDPDLTALQNLEVHARYFRIPLREARRKAHELLDFVQLSAYAHAKVQTLSGGMRRRLLLARALINNPSLLLLDEPTVGLDPQSRLSVWSKIFALKNEGVSIILTTHSMEEAERLCDLVAIVDHGRIIAFGPPKDLIAKHVPKEVVEVRSSNGLPTIGPWQNCRVERTNDTLYIYTDDAEPIVANLPSKNLSVLRRRTNLEDVFLTLTGREMRE